MSLPRTCPQCQQSLPADAPEGLCPACVMQNLAASQPGDPTKILPDGGKPAPLIDIADPAEIAKRLPQFEILELLGRGGMGVVYKARQKQLDRLVALKILPPEDSPLPDFIARFTREARSLAKLNHPNIVTVHDFGESTGLYYFIMEYVDGANLRQLLQSKKLTADEALAIVPKVCDALEYAHEEGVVHRDIKPENILVDKKGRVKIADFGLAKLLRREALDVTLTFAGSTLGTLRYMAPEQMDKPETVDHRADIYSLGVVFYEMLTGETPVGRFQLPSQMAQVDVRLDDIVLHALEKEPDRRYQHASEVKTDVENVAGKVMGSDLKAPSTAKASDKTDLLTHWIKSAAWTGIIGFWMFKAQSAWPLLALFLSSWKEPEIDNENAKEWSRVFWIACVVGLSGYGVWIAQSAWPVAGLLFVFNWGKNSEEELEEPEDGEDSIEPEALNPKEPSGEKVPSLAKNLIPSGENQASHTVKVSPPSFLRHVLLPVLLLFALCFVLGAYLKREKVENSELLLWAGLAGLLFLPFLLLHRHWAARRGKPGLMGSAPLRIPRLRSRFWVLAALVLVPAAIYVPRPSPLPDPEEVAGVVQDTVFIAPEAGRYRFFSWKDMGSANSTHAYALNLQTTILQTGTRTLNWNTRGNDLQFGFFHRHATWRHRLTGLAHGDWRKSAADGPDWLPDEELVKMRPFIVAEMDRREPGRGRLLSKMLDYGEDVSSDLCWQNALVLLAWLSLPMALLSLLIGLLIGIRKMWRRS